MMRVLAGTLGSMLPSPVPAPLPFLELIIPFGLEPLVPGAAALVVPAGWTLLFGPLSGGLVAMGFWNVLSGGEADEPERFDGDGGDDGMGFGDGFGDEFEEADGWDDGLGEEEPDPASELAPRLDGLEGELADLASTVSAVRGEHEGMRESVESIEDNVRKLLEVYEVVTRGVNPFVDDTPEVRNGGDSFGLFGSDAGGADDGPAGAGGGNLFGGAGSDEDDDGPDAGAGPAADDDGETAPVDDGVPVDEGPTDEGASPEERAATFDELRSAYQSGGPGWTEEWGEPGDETVADADPAAVEPPAPADDGGAVEGTPSAPGRAGRSAADGPGKPYLRELSGGYVDDLLVMEWLDFLVRESSTADALRAIHYYERLEWIAAGVADELRTVLGRLGPEGEAARGGSLATADGGEPSSARRASSGVQSDGGAPSSTRRASSGVPSDDGELPRLSVDHHTRSLEYVARLGDVDVDPGRFSWAHRGAGPRHRARYGGEAYGFQR